jgi:D-alanine-D-alanine ligase
LQTDSGFYDYRAKYTDGVTRHICPAVLPADIEAAARAIAVRAHEALGCRGTSRADYRWDPADGVDGLYLLEVNTQPGMTPLSLVPEQALHCGISYEALVQRLLDVALEGRR